MIHFVGAGPGAVDLITVRGQRYLKEADVIIYAGSLVNKGLLEYAKEGCEVYNSAYMTLEEVIEVMIKSEKEDKMTVRLHTGDPCLYGAGGAWLSSARVVRCWVKSRNERNPYCQLLR